MVPGKEIAIDFFASGYCEAHQRIVDPVNGRGVARFYAVWALLRHPAFGTMLFDTGYTPRFHSVTRSFPEKAYALATPVFIDEAETAANQLIRLGIQPGTVDYVVLSHLHADHIGGAADFPNATYICSRAALKQLEESGRWGGVRNGILRDLLPRDFRDRVVVLEDLAESYVDEVSGLSFFRIFEQQDFELVLLPGHARGMLGFKSNAEGKKLLFGTDASWNSECFRRDIFPARIVRLFIDSWTDLSRTHFALRKFAATHPGWPVLFTHCPETLNWLR